MVSSVLLGFKNLVDHTLQIEADFRNNDGSGTDCKTALKGNVSRTVSHNLYHTASFMRASCVAELVYHFHDRIHCRIKAYCIFG